MDSRGDSGSQEDVYRILGRRCVDTISKGINACTCAGDLWVGCGVAVPRNSMPCCRGSWCPSWLPREVRYEKKATRRLSTDGSIAAGRKQDLPCIRAGSRTARRALGRATR